MIPYHQAKGTVLIGSCVFFLFFLKFDIDLVFEYQKGGEPRLRVRPAHYLAHTPLPQRMDGGGGRLLFFVCFCPGAK
jgi:hypothetical protein